VMPACSSSSRRIPRDGRDRWPRSSRACCCRGRRGRKARGRSARRARAPPAGIRALQAGAEDIEALPRIDRDRRPVSARPSTSRCGCRRRSSCASCCSR
jgi:hypothetical protein